MKLMVFSRIQVKELIAVAVGATIMMNALVAGYVLTRDVLMKWFRKKIHKQSSSVPEP
jgi:hypothetical protein